MLYLQKRQLKKKKRSETTYLTKVGDNEKLTVHVYEGRSIQFHIGDQLLTNAFVCMDCDCNFKIRLKTFAHTACLYIIELVSAHRIIGSLHPAPQ